MLTNVVINHKFKLGDKVWFKAQTESYKTCKTCNSQNQYQRKVKVISAKVTRIRSNIFLNSSPGPGGYNVTYDVVAGKKIPAVVSDIQCFKTKKEAEKSAGAVTVYGL